MNHAHHNPSGPLRCAVSGHRWPFATRAGSGYRRLTAGVAGALLVLVSLVGTSANAATVSVDPGTLNPPVPAEFNPSCASDGSHISCNLAFSEPHVADEPAGFACNGTEMRDSVSRSVVGKRLYDGDGNLLQRHFREFLDGTFTNPDTGRVARWTEHDTVIHNLAVPGDIGSGTEQVSGLGIRIFLPGGGTILTDAGTFIVDDATGELVKESGHHLFLDVLNGDPVASARLCAAFD